VTYPFEVDGYTYHLQSLVFLPYFGAPQKTSVNKWFSLNNDLRAACGFSHFNPDDVGRTAVLQLEPRLRRGVPSARR
jgi:hypothetical protein